MSAKHESCAGESGGQSFDAAKTTALQAGMSALQSVSRLPAFQVLIVEHFINTIIRHHAPDVIFRLREYDLRDIPVRLIRLGSAQPSLDIVLATVVARRDGRRLPRKKLEEISGVVGTEKDRRRRIVKIVLPKILSIKLGRNA